MEKRGTELFKLFKGRYGEAILPAIAILTLMVDQVSKHVVLTTLRPGESWTPLASLGRWVSITHVTNTGAAFGLFPDQGLVFIAIAVIVVVIIMVYHRHLPADQWLIKISLGLQLGGALGNLLDRLRSSLAAEGSLLERLHQAYVVDFIDFKIWPVFNLADSAIVLGVAILAYYLLLNPSQTEDESSQVQRGTREEHWVSD